MSAKIKQPIFTDFTKFYMVVERLLDDQIYTQFQSQILTFTCI